MLLLAVAPASGCYLRHGLEDSPRVTPPAALDAGRGARPDASPTRDAAGLDADVVRSADASVAVDVPSECESLCDAWEANGCAVTGCLMSCLARAAQAERIGCLAEWKLINDCLRSDPCEAEGCPDRSGWPECLRRGGG